MRTKPSPTLGNAHGLLNTHTCEEYNTANSHLCQVKCQEDEGSESTKTKMRAIMTLKTKTRMRAIMTLKTKMRMRVITTLKMKMRMRAIMTPKMRTRMRASHDACTLLL